VASASLEELIKHGLRALRDTLPPEVDLTTKNVSIGYVGKGQNFKILVEDETGPFLAMIQGEERRGGGSHETAGPLRDDAGDQDQGPRDPAPAVAMDTE
jgi:20S proteasome subunit alpha 6